jgi:hypothetical protein
MVETMNDPASLIEDALRGVGDWAFSHLRDKACR